MLSGPSLCFKKGRIFNKGPKDEDCVVVLCACIHLEEGVVYLPLLFSALFL